MVSRPSGGAGWTYFAMRQDQATRRQLARGKGGKWGGRGRGRERGRSEEGKTCLNRRAFRDGKGLVGPATLLAGQRQA